LTVLDAPDYYRCPLPAGVKEGKMNVRLKRVLTIGAAALFLIAGPALAHGGRAFPPAVQPGVGSPLAGHAGPVSSVAFNPNGLSLAAATENGTVQLWDLRGDRLVGTLRGLVRTVDSVAFSPDGRSLAAGGFTGTITVWREIA
jgi:WD40 repeat protein